MLPSRRGGKGGFASAEPKQEEESERRKARVGGAEGSVILSSQGEPRGSIRSGAMLSWEERGESMSGGSSPKGRAGGVGVAGKAAIAAETEECVELRKEGMERTSVRDVEGA